MARRGSDDGRSPAAGPGRYTRRDVVGLGGLAAAGAALAACDPGRGGRRVVAESQEFWLRQPKRDHLNFAMIKLGINPERSTPEDWQRAATVLLQQRDAGLVRSYYDQSYINALADGETWISMAWSGDIFQQNQSSGTNLRFAIPAEGGTIWTDNMVIPKHAANPVGAMMLMDWYYRPPVAAMLTTGIGYVTAVPSVRAIISAHARAATGRTRRALTELATSTLVWPDRATYQRLYHYVNVHGQLKVEYQSVFQPIVAS